MPICNFCAGTKFTWSLKPHKIDHEIFVPSVPVPGRSKREWFRERFQHRTQDKDIEAYKALISISILKGKGKPGTIGREIEQEAPRKTGRGGIGREFREDEGGFIPSNPSQSCFPRAPVGAFCAPIRHTSAGSGVRSANRTSAAASELLRIVGDRDRGGRRPWFERIPGFAALAFPMPQDAVDDAGICNKGDDAHAAAAGAQQRIRFEDFLNQPSPRAAGFPGAIRIVPLGKSRCRQAGAFSICRSRGNPAAVGIGPVKSLTMASRIRDMRRDAVNPLERIQLDRGCAGPWIGRRFQNQVAVVEFFERIHGQYRPGDVSGLRFQRGDFGGFDRRSGIDRKSGMHPFPPQSDWRRRSACCLVVPGDSRGSLYAANAAVEKEIPKEQNRL